MQFPPTPEDDRPSPPPSFPPSDDGDVEVDEAVEFDQALKDIEQSLLLLKARYAQVQLDRQRQQELQQRKRQIENQLQSPASQTSQLELKRELKQVRQRLEELEVALESQLFSWSGLKEVFWQALRFGGLGVVMGWALKSVMGNG